MTNPKSDIFCPNCSAKNKIEQNFCRFCGFNLQDAAKSLARQLSVDKDRQQFNQLKLIKRLTDFASVGLIIIVSTGVIISIYAILNHMIFSGKRVFLGIFLIGMIFEFAIRQVRRIKRRRVMQDEAKTNQLPKTGEPEKVKTAKMIEEKPFMPAAAVGGVTENTTELLFAENKTRKLG
ncbi:MAG TPA: zinc ribbon domain-containing protein [Pyrinomonadaceae bacterium]|nr:zinc ribbon domain-containing protein [Pyrinomonadaceae bacterium]